MITVKLFGQPTSTYEYTKKTLMEEVARAGVEMTLWEINDVNEFIKEGIKSVPTIKINNHVEINYTGREEMTAFLRQSIQSILKEEDFGRMQKVVIPTDFSESSKNAIAYAMRLFEEKNAVLRLVHAYHPISGDINGISMIDPHLELQKRDQLKTLLEDLKQSHSYNDDSPFIDEQFRVGYAGDEIIKMSKNEDVDMIVMGSTGKGGTMKKWFGSVSLEVAKRAECPVLVIPPSSHFHPIRKVLYASNYSEHDLRVVKDIIGFLDNPGLELHIAHVMNDEAESSTKDLLTEALKLSFPGHEITFKDLPSGNVTNHLAEYASTESFDLVVMTRGQKSRWQEMTLQSATRKMAILPRGPLLIYHENDRGCCCGKNCPKKSANER